MYPPVLSRVGVAAQPKIDRSIHETRSTAPTRMARKLLFFLCTFPLTYLMASVFLAQCYPASGQLKDASAGLNRVRSHKPWMDSGVRPGGHGGVRGRFCRPDPCCTRGLMSE